MTLESNIKELEAQISALKVANAMLLEQLDKMHDTKEAVLERNRKLEARAEEFTSNVALEVNSIEMDDPVGSVLKQIAIAPVRVAFIAGARAQHEITRQATIDEVLGLLRSEEASSYAFSMLETKKCSENDAHITRHDWAAWLEANLKGEG